MSRYDGLIIPRSYSDYINKTDAATLLQALQLSGVMDNAPIEGSNHPVKSGGVYEITPVNVIENNNQHAATSNIIFNDIKKQNPIAASELTLPTGWEFQNYNGYVQNDMIIIFGSMISSTGIVSGGRLVMENFFPNNITPKGVMAFLFGGAATINGLLGLTVTAYTSGNRNLYIDNQNNNSVVKQIYFNIFVPKR